MPCMGCWPILICSAEWNQCFLGFCGITESNFRKLVHQPEALSLFARHYLTGEELPQHFIEKKKGRQFQQGLQTLRQLSFGF